MGKENRSAQVRIVFFLDKRKAKGRKRKERKTKRRREGRQSACLRKTETSSAYLDFKAGPIVILLPNDVISGPVCSRGNVCMELVLGTLPCQRQGNVAGNGAMVYRKPFVTRRNSLAHFGGSESSTSDVCITDFKLEGLLWLAGPHIVDSPDQSAGLACCFWCFEITEEENMRCRIECQRYLSRRETRSRGDNTKYRTNNNKNDVLTLSFPCWWGERTRMPES